MSDRAVPEDPASAFVRSWFKPDFYHYHNPDVHAAGVDPLRHYCEHGWREGRDPTPYFSLRAYRQCAGRYRGAEGDPFSHYLEAVAADARAGEEAARADHRRYRCREDGSPLPVRLPNAETLALVADSIDEDWYRRANPDIPADIWDDTSAAMHYLAIGWIEGRDPSPWFSTAFYLDENPDVLREGLNPLVHHLHTRNGHGARRTSEAIDAALAARFETGPVADAVCAAIALDPMVAMPPGRRAFASPRTYGEPALAEVARMLREHFAGRTFRRVLLLPDLADAHWTRAAGALAATLARGGEASDILIVASDGGATGGRDLLPEGVEVFDLSAFVGRVSNANLRFQLAVDLVSGVGAETLFLLESRLFWDVMRVYGRQLSEEFRVVGWLFGWHRLDERTRSGYPVEWLRDCIDRLALVVCDDAVIAEDAKARFALSGDDLPLCLPVPVDLRAPERGAPERDAPERDATMRARPHLLWTGHHADGVGLALADAVAAARPDWDVTACLVDGEEATDIAGDGEGDIAGDGEGGDDGPGEGAVAAARVHLTGPRDAVRLDADICLCTGDWTGLSATFVEAARAGLAIIAPRLGAMGNPVDGETAWLAAGSDAGAFVAEAERALGDRVAAAEKTRRLRERLAARGDEAAFAAGVGKILERIDG